jgi:hypothetical protein
MLGGAETDEEMPVEQEGLKEEEVPLKCLLAFNGLQSVTSNNGYLALLIRRLTMSRLLYSYLVIALRAVDKSCRNVPDFNSK